MPDADVVETLEHYELLADEMADPGHAACDPFDDPPVQRAWMEQADCPAFYEALGPVQGKTLLEVGVGTGRVARRVLKMGCAYLVGLDLSPKTLARAGVNLGAPPNVDLVVGGIEAFRRPGAFDAAYSVWTFFHVENKPLALANVVESLKIGGHLVLSLERVDEYLDYGSRRIRQYPVAPEAYVEWLRELGCRVDPPLPVAASAPGSDSGVFTTILTATRER